MTTAAFANESSEEHLDFADMRRRIRAIFIGIGRRLVEWYDFYAYAAFALYFAGAFTSIAIIDALKMFAGPIIELHISNIHRFFGIVLKAAAPASDLRLSMSGMGH